MKRGSQTKSHANGPKLVECKKHGLVYDVRSSTGCVLCVRERKQFDRGGSSRGYLLVAALIVVIIGAFVYVFFLGGRQAQEEQAIAGVSIERRPSGRPADAVAKEREKKAAEAIGNLVSELSRLAENAKSDMETMGETRVDLSNIDDGENRTRLSTWRFWVDSWLRDVEKLGRVNSRQKIKTPRDLSQALRSAEFALRRMKQVPNPGPGIALESGDEGLKDYYLPDQGARKAWLTEIFGLVEQSRRQLEKGE